MGFRCRQPANQFTFTSAAEACSCIQLTQVLLFKNWTGLCFGKAAWLIECEVAHKACFQGVQRATGQARVAKTEVLAQLLGLLAFNENHISDMKRKRWKVSNFQGFSEILMHSL